MAHASSTSFSLEQFVKHHDVPCTVVVTRGYSYGEADEEESLSNGELITLHSVQQTQVVKARDHLNREVTLPVAGTRKYELLPEQPRLDNIVYETVADIIRDEKMPEKVRVTAAVDSGDDESSIYVDDVLEIRNVEGKAGGTSSDQPALVAINQFGEKLRLPLSTPGKFSPQLDIKWYSMAEIVNFGVFPQRVHLVSIQPGHRHRGHDKFSLLKTELETNVLVTVNKELLSLPLTAEIEVMIPEQPETDESDQKELKEELPPPPPEIQQVYISTESVSSAAPSITNPFHAEMTVQNEPLRSPSPSMRSEQDDPFGLSQEDQLKVKAGSVRRFGSVLFKRRNNVDVNSDAPEQVFQIYERLQEKTAECIRLREDANKWQSRFQRLELQHQNNKRQLQHLQRMAEFWKSNVEDTQVVDENVIQLMREYVRNPTLDLSEAQKPRQLDSETIARRKETKPEPVKRKGATVTPTVAPKPGTVSPEKMSVSDIQQILNALNMQQYSKAFLDEQVDGGLLLELDDDSLQADLGIKSALHRKKLQRTMQGKGTPLRELLSAK